MYINIMDNELDGVYEYDGCQGQPHNILVYKVVVYKGSLASCIYIGLLASCTCRFIS